MKLSKVSAANLLNGATPTSLVLRVDWLGTSPNVNRFKHWTRIRESDNEARAAWSRCVSSLSEQQKQMMTTLRERIKHCETQSQQVLKSMTGTPESGLDTLNALPEADPTP